MTRSLWKGPFLDQFVLKKILSADESTPIKIWSRRSYILPQFVGQTVAIYTGKSFLSVKITEEMIGHKFGEFASTRKRPVHKKKEKKNKMGQKSTPTSLRLGLNRHFSHTWFADRLFASLLHQQKTCQEFLQTLFKSIGIRTERSHVQQAPQSIKLHSFFCDPRVFESQYQTKLASLVTTPFFQNASKFFIFSPNQPQKQYSWFLTQQQKTWDEARHYVVMNFFLLHYHKTKSKKMSVYQIPMETQNHIVFGNYKKTTSKAREVQFYQNHISQILTHYTKSEASWHPIKVKSPTKTAHFIAHQAANKFEQNISFRQIFKYLVQTVKKEKTIQGFKMTCSGRLGGAEMARVESKRFGQTSLHTFFQKIEYASVCAYTPYGLIGVKVWVSYKPRT